MNDSPPQQVHAAVKAAIERIEEGCAVMDTLESAWESPEMADDTKLRTLLSVRRSMIDVAAGLHESISTPN